MPGQPLKQIQIEGFTSISSATVDLGRVNILVGANGAGKSNFVQALAMLGRIVDGELGLFVGLNGGGTALLAMTTPLPGFGWSSTPTRIRMRPC